jgi:XisH protein
VGGIGYEIDFGAEKLLAAEKGTEKIAVELKSFAGPSEVNEFHRAVGQFNDYAAALEIFEPIRVLSSVYRKLFGKIFFKKYSLKKHWNGLEQG